jgi:hypothetical protein
MQRQQRPLGPYLRAIYRLPKAFIVDAQLVRGPQESRIRLDGVEGLLSLPQLARGAFGWPRLIAPPLIKLGGEADRSSGRGRSSQWGHPLIDRLDAEGSVLIHMVGMRFPLPAGEEKVTRQIAARLFEAVGPWSTKLSSWIDVTLNGKPTEPLRITPWGAKSPEELHGLELLYIDQVGDRSRQFPPRQPNVVLGEAIAKLTEGSWRAILDHVSTGVAPPAERLLLHDALIGLDQGHVRRAVLDAATAAEIALTRILDDKLRSVPRVDAEGERRGPWGLRKLGDAVQRFGVELPPRFREDLADIRNQAIHVGMQPTRDQSRAAFLIAREVVNRAQPLDALLTPHEHT